MSQIVKDLRTRARALPLFVMLGAGSAGLMLASSVTVSINTASLAGTQGDLAFDFIAGGTSTNTVTISGFSSDGMLGSSTLSGSASGAFPGTVSLTTADFFNEYLTGFTFGSVISFTENQTDNPPGMGGTPDEFSLYLLDPTGSFSLITTNDPTGADALFASGSDQSQSVFTSPDVTTMVQPAATVPEAGTVCLCALGLCGLAALRRRIPIRGSSVRGAGFFILAALSLLPIASAQSPNPSKDIGPPLYQYKSQGAALGGVPGGPPFSVGASGVAKGCQSMVPNPPTGVPSGAAPDPTLPFSGCTVAVSNGALPLLAGQVLQVAADPFGQPWFMSGVATENADLERMYAGVQLDGVGPNNTAIASASVTYYQQNLGVEDFDLVPGQYLELNINVIGTGDSIVSVCVWSGNNQGCGGWNFSNDGEEGVLDVPPVLIAPDGLYTVAVGALTINATANSTSFAATRGFFSAVRQPLPNISLNYTPVDAFDNPFIDTTVRRESDTGARAGVDSPNGGPTEGWYQSPQGTFASIVAPGDNTGNTAAFDLNDNGTIVGSYQQNTGGAIDYHGFLFNNGSYSTYDMNPGQSTQIFGINNNGDFVGSFTSVGQPEQGFLQLATGGAPTILAFPNATVTRANGVNGSDTVVGRWIDSNNVSHGFIQTPGGMPLSFDFPGATGTFPFSITDAGTVSGHFSDSGGLLHGFVGHPSGLVQYDLPGAQQTGSVALNNQGVVGGAYLDSGGIAHGFRAQLCEPDISSQFRVSRAGFLLNHGTGELAQQITVTNTSSQTIAGPILVLLRNLSSGVIMDNGNRLSICTAPGAPYLKVNPVGGTLLPGQSAQVTANFANYSKGGISYTISVLQGGNTSLP